MIVRQPTLPWIPGQQSAPVARRRSPRANARRRGMGDSVTLDFPWIVPADGSSGGSLPCIPAGAMGPPAIGQSYCAGPAVTTADNWDSKTAGSTARVCFQGLFPWVGQAAADGSCIPVINVPSPWPLVITAGIVGFVGFKLLGGRR